jgi:hypothetical protein
MMVRVDEQWDRLKLVQKAGFKTPTDHPDIDPPHEALQLAEQFREALRLTEVRARGEDFMRRMEMAERQAIRVRDTLQGYGKNPSAELRKEVEAVFAAESKSCSGCHTQHRDTRSR